MFGEQGYTLQSGVWTKRGQVRSQVLQKQWTTHTTIEYGVTERHNMTQCVDVTQKKEGGNHARWPVCTTARPRSTEAMAEGQCQKLSVSRLQVEID